MPTNLEIAIDKMHLALDYDSHQKYDEALKLYEKGIELFLDALYNEIDGEMAQKAIVRKTKIYCDRAEELRQVINGKKSGVSPAEPSECSEAKGKHLQNAIEILIKARQEDKRKNAREALRLYEEGLVHYDIVLKDQIMSEKFKEALQNRRKVYEERMNILKERLHMK